jgi:putative SOS response-associated peptidase YedK
MCYDVVSATRTLIKYAKHRQDSPELIAELERKLQRLTGFNAMYQVSGFEHPNLLVFTNELMNEPQLYQWGLIPAWIKTEAEAAKIANQTLNARAEYLWEKPSFKHAVEQQRCLVYIDAFYEHHHYAGKTFPYHIALKDGSPMALAGIWETWLNPRTGLFQKTVSIITTQGNSRMAQIHNNPKLEEPRMPAILPKAIQNEWLKPSESISPANYLKSLLKPLSEDELEYYTVRRLKGKDAVGNKPEAEKEYTYVELQRKNQPDLFSM